MTTMARWAKAQAAECAFWHHYRSIPTYREFDYASHWAACLRWLDISREAWAIKTVIEVGCGPAGLIFYLPPCLRRVGVDPLAGQLPKEPVLSPAPVVRAMGECLPIRTASCDFVICCNVLDHVLNPVAVLAEIRRILRPDGRCYFMVHTFPRLLCPLLGFDAPHTSHWSQLQLLQLLTFAGFVVDRYATAPMRLDIKWRSIWDIRTWKQIAASWIVKTVYVMARTRFDAA